MTCVFLVPVFGRLIPGLTGEFFAQVLGFVTTPFILETTLCIVGFVTVLTVNQWRLMREGDELVYLEEVQNGPADLPDQARWAVYADKPLEPGNIAATDLLEGALSIADHEAAVFILETMTDSERLQPEVLRMRIQLAEATGKASLALQLKRRLEDGEA